MNDIALPRLTDGSVDWDHVFDAPGSGLVTLIEQAGTAKDLHQGMQMILKTLFNREGDAKRRTVFTNLVNEILADAKKTKKSPAAVMAVVKIRVVQILHSIKQDRQDRARKAQATKARKDQDSGSRSGLRPASAERPNKLLGFDDRQPDEVHIAVPKAIAPQEDYPDPIEDGPIEDNPVDDDLIKEGPVDGSTDDGPTDDEIAEWLKNSPTGTSVLATDDTGGEESKLPDEFFIDVIVASILENLAALRGDLTDGGSTNGKLPFILSPAFATRFEWVLREHVVPGFAEGRYVTISNMAAEPRSKWLSNMTEVFADPSQSLMLWERWQLAWLDATAQRDEPPPPFVDPAKQGLRGLMVRMFGSDDVFAEEVEMTQEEWEEAVEETQQENLRAREVWSLLSAESDDLHSPLDVDNRLLMGLFRSHDDLDEHIARLRRFAKDSDTAGPAFDSYLPGKDLDLPLLCACYRYPDELMSGGKTLVSTFVGGMDRRRGEAALPLCCRYLGAAMGKRFVEK